MAEQTDTHSHALVIHSTPDTGQSVLHVAQATPVNIEHAILLYNMNKKTTIL